jgi:hypothetical protein
MKNLNAKEQEVLDYLLANTEFYNDEHVGKFVKCDPSDLDLTPEQFDNYMIILDLRDYIEVVDMQVWSGKPYRKGDAQDVNIEYRIA